jgi:hypothetical protein
MKLSRCYEIEQVPATGESPEHWVVTLVDGAIEIGNAGTRAEAHRLVDDHYASGQPSVSEWTPLEAGQRWQEVATGAVVVLETYIPNVVEWTFAPAPGSANGDLTQYGKLRIHLIREHFRLLAEHLGPSRQHDLDALRAVYGGSG